MSNPNEEYQDEIAIIGLTGRFPGAKNIAEFWRNLSAGKESISFFTEQELAASGVSSKLLNSPNYVRAKPVLSDIEMFDAEFFRVNPREAEMMDPQQRIFLECAWEALEDAGYDPERYRGRIGVYAGVDMNSYLLNNLAPNQGLLSTFSAAQLLTWNDKDYLCTRASYKLNLRGPSVSVQTACSSSLVAVHLASESLFNGECDLALAGGIAISVPAKAGYLYEEGGVVSPDGHCRTFDAHSHGTIFGNGVGLVVLKRLADALDDGDHIYAVVKGSAINNDGAIKIGYTAPSEDGVAMAIAEAQAVAQVKPETITYIEAHGTGTELGDPIEVAALTRAFRRSTAQKGFCALGSVKTNVGHLGAAAGVTGLIKTALALEHKQIPASLNFQQPNPRIDFENSPFYVNTTLAEWKQEKFPRRAGISSLGMGGTNAHLVLEEAPQREPSSPSRPQQLLVFSARSASALDMMTNNLASYLHSHPVLPLADVAYTLQVGRHAFKHRRILVCETQADATAAMQSFQPDSIQQAAETEPAVAFMFSGQGAQYVDMGRELYDEEPTFRKLVDECAEKLQPYLGLDLRRVLYPDLAQATSAAEQLGQTWLTQPALFVIEYALAKLWMEWGVHPKAMIGHSIGEYVAACLSGVFSLDDALVLVAARGRLMQSLPGGAMLAVPLSESDVRPLLGDTLSLAAVNAPDLCVVSGPTEAVDALDHVLAERGLDGRRLRTSHAFHSAMMDSILGLFTEQVSRLKLNPPQIPCVSNVTGTWLTAADATDPNYWARHLRQAVNFSQGLELLFKDPAQILLEVGPGRTLSSLALRHSARNGNQVVLSSLRQAQASQSDIAFGLTTLGKLWQAGVSVNWDGFYAHESRHRISLPTYPFERQRYWVEPGQDGRTDLMSLVKNQNLTEWFYIPSWKRTLPPLFSETTGSITRWLFFSQRDRLSINLAQYLKSAGGQMITVLEGERFAFEDGVYTIRPGQREDYDALLAALVKSDQAPDHIVHLWNVVPGDKSDHKAAENALQRSFYSLLFLAQALGKQGVNATRLSVVSSGMQSVIGREVIQPEKATILGPCQVIPQEMPGLHCQSIDIEMDALGADPEERSIEMLAAELMTDLSEPIVAYRGDTRWARTYEQSPISDANESIGKRLRAQGVYLITGGLGGLGLTFARYLANTVQARLVLTSRSPFPNRDDWEEYQAKHDPDDRICLGLRMIHEMEAAGSAVLVVQADVADQAQMEAVVHLACERFGTLHGVIHAAGLPGGGLLQLKTEESVSRLLAPKVQGVRVLEKALAHLSLDFLVLCSSTIAVMGGVGQVDYCAANAFMDAFAWSKKHRGGSAVISINWDAWGSVGMAVNTSSMLISRDLSQAIMPDEGLEAFKRILGRGSLSQIVVSPKHLPTLIRMAQESLLDGLLSDTSVDMRSQLAKHARPALQNPYEPPRNDIEAQLAVIWQDVLGIEQVGVHDSFFDLGGDSLLSLQVIARARAIGIHFDPKQLFEHPTIATLAIGDDSLKTLSEQGIVTGAVPLTPNQYWFLGINAVLPILFQVTRSLQPALLEQAVKVLLRHHDALRSRFVGDFNYGEYLATQREAQRTGVILAEPERQWIVEPDDIAPFTYVNIQGLSEMEKKSVLETTAAKLHVSLNLTTGPTLQVAYFDAGQQQPGYVFLLISHLVSDQYSLRILTEDLLTIYQQFSQKQVIHLPSKTTSYKAWAEHLVNYAKSPDLHDELNYWRNLPWDQTGSLPLDYPDGIPENTFGSTQVLALALEKDETDTLLARYGARLPDVLAAATGIMFKRWSGKRMLALTLVTNGRWPIFPDVDVSRTTGLFGIGYPVLLDIGDADPEPSVLQGLLAQMDNVPNQGITFGILHRLSGPEIGAKMDDLFSHCTLVVNYLGRQEMNTKDGDLNWIRAVSLPSFVETLMDSPESKRPHLLKCTAVILEGKLLLRWEYSTNLHKSGTIERISQDCLNTLRSFAALP